MKLSAILTALFFIFAALAMPDSCDAARMGGGKSFGGRPSMSAPARAPAAPTRNQATPGAAATAAKPGGMFGGMGGIMGGLLAGTLLGSLLSGNGFGGGGGFLDLILLAVLAYVAWRLFSRFKAAKQGGAQTSGGYGVGAPQGGMFQQDASQSQPYSPGRNTDQAGAGGGIWDSLRGGAPSAGLSPKSASPEVDVPAGFDIDEFLRGAKMAYTRMQQSWDQRDLDDIANFVTPTVMRELQAQAKADPNPSRTEIMLVNASLAGVEMEGENTRAQVYFDVLMREDPKQATPEQVREIWHFLRIGPNGDWRLDGIQQVN